MKKITALLLAVVMVFALTACGGDKKTDGKVTLTIGLPNGDTLTPMTLIEQFKEANPDINVVVDEAPWNDFRSKLDLQLGSGTAPDIFITDSGHTATLGANGAAMDLSEKIKTDLNADDYIGALYASQDAEGHVWGIPHGLNSIALYYNEDLFDKAGLDYPTEDWTFQDMVDAAKKLTTPKDKNGISDVYGLHVEYSITGGWLPFITSTGGAPLDETMTKSNFNNSKTLEGIKKFEEVIKSGITPPIPWTTTKGSMEAAFYTGSTAMSIMRSASTKIVNENAPEGFRYNVVSMPYGWDGTRDSIYVPNAWIINSKSSAEEQEAAWKWLKFYLSEESQLLLAEECRGGYPIHKSAIEYCSSVDAVPKNRDVFYKNIDETGVTLYENGTWAKWKPEVDKLFMDLYNGVLTSEEVAKQAHKKVSEILAQ